MHIRRGRPLKARKKGLSRYLTDARQEAGLSQKQAGEALHQKDGSLICRLELGIKTPPPDVLSRILRQLAIAYDIHLDVLLKQAGLKEFPWHKIVREPNDAPDTILDDTTNDEKRELKRYLAFMRLGKR